MSDIGFWGNRNDPFARDRGLSSDGRWALALGILAMLIGLAAALGGAYVGLGTSARLVSLPGGLPAAPSETVAILMFTCGAITVLLGAISLYKAFTT